MSRYLKLLLAAGLVEDERVPEDARVRLFADFPFVYVDDARLGR